jgi:hypothetical protein
MVDERHLARGDRSDGLRQMGELVVEGRFAEGFRQFASVLPKSSGPPLVASLRLIDQ